MNKPSFSRIIAGTMSWGIWGKNCNQHEMITLLNTCLENGITTFDHADIYGDYTTEAAFGVAFRASGLRREEVQFISKCGIQMESHERKNVVKHYDYSKNYIIWSVEQSLQKLQTEYLDVLLLHRPSPLMQADEIAAAVEELKQAGKIVDFGVSNFSPSQVDLIQTKIKINYNQIQFSVTHPNAMLDGSLDHMQMNGIQPMAWSPLGSIFTEDDSHAQRVKSLASFHALTYEVPVDVLLLAWILKHPAGILPVCGTADAGRISQLMRATTVELSLQDWFALWQESRGVPVP
ncbi:aldo/keto reductase [Arundinibacter roseus]|uniref:Aldo/keto reductase n=1 Tax=Arundinibacter roseus TaxID=2070510 RepID=A0A4R4K834_9BACT|nr:aldo/keto reductase [Arundinibacter roseus]TDB62349.1 aldo/keto reductase [Arundinibacter roseus]